MPTPEEIKEYVNNALSDWCTENLQIVEPWHQVVEDLSFIVQNAIQELSKDYCIVPKNLLNEDYLQMAQDYAMYLDPDNKINRTMIELDCLGYLNCVLGKYCIVPKSQVIMAHEMEMKACESTNKPAAHVFRQRALLLETLFGKELFNEE